MELHRGLPHLQVQGRGRDKRTTKEQEEFSDKGLFEKLLEAEEDYEAYLENENEYYTQSYTGQTKDDYPWEEEEGEAGEGKKETKATAEASAGLTEEAGRGEKEEDQGDQPQDQGASKGEGKGDGRIRVPARLHEGVEGVLRRWSDLQAALRDQGKDLGRPRLDLQAPERRKRQERKRKGQGRRRKGKISSGFVPRDEEDRKYWEEMDRQSEEQKKKKEAAAGKKKQEE